MQMTLLIKAEIVYSTVVVGWLMEFKNCLNFQKNMTTAFDDYFKQLDNSFDEAGDRNEIDSPKGKIVWPDICLRQSLYHLRTIHCKSVASNWLILISELSLLPFRHDQPFISDLAKLVVLKEHLLIKSRTQGLSMPNHSHKVTNDKRY